MVGLGNERSAMGANKPRNVYRCEHDDAELKSDKETTLYTCEASYSRQDELIIVINDESN